MHRTAALAGRALMLVAVVTLGTSCRSNTPAIRSSPAPSATGVLPASSSPTPTPGASEADLDGDGRSDHVSMTGGAPDANGRTVWTLTVSFASGQTSSVVIGAYAAAYMRPKVLGAADADGQAGDELFVLVDKGASTQTASIVGAVGHRLVEATNGRDVLRLAFGGSAGHEDGAQCLANVGGRRGLAVLTATSDNRAGGPAHWQERDYAWNAKSVQPIKTTSGTFSSVAAAPARFTRIVCGSLVIDQYD